MKGLSHDRSRGGFTLVELLVALTIISILALIALPHFVGSREKAAIAACDENVNVLVSELQNRLDANVNAGSPTAAEDAIDAVLAAQQTSKNPRRLADPAYVDNGTCAAFVPTPGSSCQIFLCSSGSDTIEGQQYEGGTTRIFSVDVE